MFSVEVTADDQHLPPGLDDFLDHVACLLHMVVCISTVWHVHTHQGDTLCVDCDRGGNGTFADVICPVYLVLPLLIHNKGGSVFVLEFPTHMMI